MSPAPHLREPKPPQPALHPAHQPRESLCPSALLRSKSPRRRPRLAAKQCPRHLTRCVVCAGCGSMLLLNLSLAAALLASMACASCSLRLEVSRMGRTVCLKTWKLCHRLPQPPPCKLLPTVPLQAYSFLARLQLHRPCRFLTRVLAPYRPQVERFRKPCKSQPLSVLLGLKYCKPCRPCHTLVQLAVPFKACKL